MHCWSLTYALPYILFVKDCITYSRDSTCLWEACARFINNYFQLSFVCILVESWYLLPLTEVFSQLNMYTISILLVLSDYCMHSIYLQQSCTSKYFSCCHFPQLLWQVGSFLSKCKMWWLVWLSLYPFELLWVCMLRLIWLLLSLYTLARNKASLTLFLRLACWFHRSQGVQEGLYSRNEYLIFSSYYYLWSMRSRWVVSEYKVIDLWPGNSSVVHVSGGPKSCGCININRKSTAGGFSREKNLWKWDSQSRNGPGGPVKKQCSQQQYFLGCITWNSQCLPSRTLLSQCWKVYYVYSSRTSLSYLVVLLDLS